MISAGYTSYTSFQLSFLICYITAREDAKADFLKAKFVSGPYLSIHNLICWKGEFEQGDKRKWDGINLTTDGNHSRRTRERSVEKRVKMNQNPTLEKRKNKVWNPWSFASISQRSNTNSSSTWGGGFVFSAKSRLCARSAGWQGLSHRDVFEVRRGSITWNESVNTASKERSGKKRVTPRVSERWRNSFFFFFLAMKRQYDYRVNKIWIVREKSPFFFNRRSRRRWTQKSSLSSVSKLLRRWG